MATSSGEVLQIAYISDKRLKVNMPNMNSILHKVGSCPMAIISINGPMRSGKSYILNHFIRYLSNPNTEWINTKLDNEFHWKNSSERQTTGINMWSEPFIVKRNNEEIAVLLMDTQGCFDDKTTNQENALIFALSCSLSSTLIYNVKNQLAEDSLEFLQMFVSFARMSEDRSEPQSFSKLIFLIRDWEVPRDFNFGYYDDSTSAVPNFKKEKLDIKPDSIPEHIIVRQEILSAFKDVGCHLMPHPGRGLSMYDDFEKAEPDFVYGINDFIPRVLEKNIVTKYIGGKEITGDEMKKFVKLVAKSSANATIPEFKSINEANAEYQNNNAHSIALKHYRNKMDNICTELLDNAFHENHVKIEREAFEIFERNKRVHNDDIKKKYSDLLKDGINELYKNYKQMHDKIEQVKMREEEKSKKIENEMHKMSELLNLKQEETKRIENELKKIREQFESEKEEERMKMENEMHEMFEELKLKQEETKRIENELKKIREQFESEKEEERMKMENEMHEMFEELKLKQEETKRIENELKKIREQFESEKEEERMKMENEMHEMFEELKLKQEETKRIENELKKMREQFESEKEEERKKMKIEIREMKQKNESIIEQSSFIKFLNWGKDLLKTFVERYIGKWFQTDNQIMEIQLRI